MLVSPLCVLICRLKLGLPSGYLSQPPRLDLVDEPAHAVLVGDERAGLDTSDGLAHVLFKVGEGLHGEMRLDARFLLDLRLQLIVGESEHSTIGVVNQDDLARPQKTLRDRQGANLVVRYDASGVTYHVRVTLLKPQHTVDVQARVHA